MNVQDQKSKIELYNCQWIQLRDGLKNAKLFYIMVMVLITLFVLFFTLDRALPGQADQRADHGAAGGRRRGAQGQPAASRGVRADRRAGARWYAASTR